MGYINAIDVLPPEMVKQIQEYINGDVIYIPKKKGTREAWGKRTATKTALAERNQKIYAEFLQDVSIPVLANKYFMVEKSIQRIVRQEKNKN